MDIATSELHLQAQNVRKLTPRHQTTIRGLKFVIVTVLIKKTQG